MIFWRPVSSKIVIITFISANVKLIHLNELLKITPEKKYIIENCIRFAWTNSKRSYSEQKLYKLYKSTIKINQTNNISLR